MNTQPNEAGIIRERARIAFALLQPVWPVAQPLLRWQDPFQLLCAVVLSAQCTDDQVNKVTPELFARWPAAAALAQANIGDVESVIHSVGFFRTKAAHLVESARLMVANFGGQVPGSMEEMLTLPGVGRKTANLVLSACFGQAGIIVDTHVLRVCLRLGLHTKRDASLVERRIAEVVDKNDWTAFSHAINRHGKFTCTARKPACTQPGQGCPIMEICPRIGL